MFLVHVDVGATDDFKNAIRAIVDRHANIDLLMTRRCAWGSFELVRASKDMIAHGLSADDSWTHVILLSGTHLPTSAFPHMRRWVSGEKSFFSWNLIYDLRKGGEGRWLCDMRERVEWMHLHRSGLPADRREFLGRPPFAYAVGSQWVILARRHAEYCVHDAPRHITSRLEVSNVPDESYFQTLLINSDCSEECSWAESTTSYWQHGAWSPDLLEFDRYKEAAVTVNTPFVRKIAEDLGDEGLVEEFISSIMKV